MSSPSAQALLKGLNLTDFENLCIVEGDYAGTKVELLASSHVIGLDSEIITRRLVPLAILMNDDLYKDLKIGDLQKEH